MFDSLTVKSVGKMSVLPPSVSSLVREMPPCEKHMGNPEGIVSGYFSREVDTSPLTSSPAVSVALTRWRRITAFLLNPSRSERGVIIPENTPIEPRAMQLVEDMNRFLRAFVDENRRQHQKGLCRTWCPSAQSSAIPSSPSRQISHGASAQGSARKSWCAPGLDKVSDSQGVRCQPEIDDHSRSASCATR